MSLLGTPVYANPTTPLWVSAGGDTIDGTLIVNGSLITKGTVEIENGATGVVFQNAAGANTGLKVSTDAGGTNGFLETNGSLYLGRAGAGSSANTVFTPSAVTTFGDVLSLGGSIRTAAGGGVTPLASSTASTNVPLGVPTDISPTPVIPIVAGRWYDVQVTGYWSVPIGTTPAALDLAEVLASVGPGIAPGYFETSMIDKQYPGWTEDPWTAASFRPFQLRGRFLAPGNLANLVLQANLTGTGIYPAGLDAVVQSVSVVALS